MPDTPALELKGVSVEFGHHRVLSDTNFKLHADEFVVLLGANASGKTTMVKAALGLLPLSGGSASLYGTPISRFREWKRIGYVPQRVTAASGVPATVSEVVTSGRTGRSGFFGRLDAGDRKAVDRALDLVDLTDIRDSSVTKLSGGQQQRVLIARALAGEPEILVLDEPVASVDLAHQESFAGTLSALRETNTSILMVAHSLGAIRPLVTRAVVLDHGRVVHDGEPVDLHLAHAHHPEQEAS